MSRHAVFSRTGKPVSLNNLMEFHCVYESESPKKKADIQERTNFPLQDSKFFTDMSKLRKHHELTMNASKWGNF